MTLEGWVDQMYMLEKVGNPAVAITFYLLIVILGANFLINLFLAVLFDQFHKCQEEQEEATKQEEEARDRWQLLSSDAPPPKFVKGPTRVFTSQARSDCFDNLVYALITANTILMCANYWGESEAYKEMLGMANTLFTVLFFLEMAIKISFMGPKAYCTRPAAAVAPPLAPPLAAPSTPARRRPRH